MTEKEWIQLSTNIALIHLTSIHESYEYHGTEIDIQILFECRHFQILRNKKGIVPYPCLIKKETVLRSMIKDSYIMITMKMKPKLIKVANQEVLSRYNLTDGIVTWKK